MKNVEDIYPLSPLQEGILFHKLKDPDSAIYFVQYICRLRGDLNCEFFERSWRLVVERHPVLRTAFFWKELDEPLQVVHSEVKLDWQKQDLGEISESKLKEWLEVFLKDDQACGFKLNKAPLMRLRLFATGKSGYQFVWSFHHILCDGWSTSIIPQEVFQNYHKLCQGKAFDPAPVRPYRDYIAWLQKQDLSQAKSFWKKQLKELSAPTSLSFGRRQNSDMGYHQRELLLSNQITADLTNAARKNRLTLNTMIQGAWAFLLHRYSGEKDIVFGSTVSGRAACLDGVDRMVGLFINTLPVRAVIEPTMTLSCWLAKLQENQIAAREFEHSPLVKIQEWSGLPSGTPLFESILVYENIPVADSTDIRNLEFEILDVSYRDQSNYPLAVLILPGTRLRFRVVYDRSRFAESKIANLIDYFSILLQSFALHPDQCISDLPILTPLEQRHLKEWSGTIGNDFSKQSIQCMFEEQVIKVPRKTAVVYEDRSLSYFELNRRANHLAYQIRHHNPGPGTIIGIYINRSIEMIIAILAVLKTGAAYLPLDSDYPNERLAFMLTDAGVDMVLTLKRLERTLPFSTSKVITIDDIEQKIGHSNGFNLKDYVQPEDLAYVMYTSGSTGQPKGVMIDHGNLSHSTRARIEYYKNAPERFLLMSSISFDSSVAGVFGTLCRGGCLYIPNEKSYRDVNYIAELIKNGRITDLLCIPSFYEQLLQSKQTNLLSLKTVIVAGEPCSPNLVEEHFTVLPNARLFNEYGPTEATVWSSVFDCQQSFSSTSVPIGKPIANTQIYLLDRYMKPVPIGVPGELYIGGEGLARGYHNRPQLTTRKFIPNPFRVKEQDRLYKTGDLARYLSDGNLEFIGRIDNQIKLRGFRIELGEIEAVLKQQSAIQDVAVVLREDQPGAKRLVAYIVFEPGKKVTLEEIRAIIQNQLPEYMVPSAFVFLDRLPLTQNGKVDRKALPIPKHTYVEQEENYLAPRGALEIQIVKVWEKALGVDRVGIKDNFFDLGGDSLMAMRVISRIQKLTGKDISVADIFESPSVEQLAKIARSEVKSYSFYFLRPFHPMGTKPIFFSISIPAADAANLIDPEQPFYGGVPHGFSDGKRIPPSVEAIAADFVKEIRTVQPEGPYFMGGYSFGGLLSYEIACQLQRHGQQIGGLILIDPTMPAKLLKNVDENLNKKQPLADVMSSEPKMEVAHKSILEVKLRQLTSHFIIRIRRKINRGVLERRLKLVVCNIYRMMGLSVPIGLREFYCHEAFTRISKYYKPKKFIGKAFLITSTQRRHPFPKNFWQMKITEGLEIHEVPGKHLDIFRETDAHQILAKKFKMCLTKAQFESTKNNDT